MATRAEIDRYKELVAKRDAMNASVAPLKERLESLNAEIIAKQKEALELALEITKARGGAAWLDLKSELGALAMRGAAKAAAKEAAKVVEQAAEVLEQIVEPKKPWWKFW